HHHRRVAGARHPGHDRRRPGGGFRRNRGPPLRARAGGARGRQALGRRRRDPARGAGDRGHRPWAGRGRCPATAGARVSGATLITVAPTGAEVDKAKVPALPVTLAELLATATECESVGASVIHVHIRDDQARPTLDLGRLRETVAALREATSLVVQLS